MQIVKLELGSTGPDVMNAPRQSLSHAFNLGTRSNLAFLAVQLDVVRQ